MAERQQRLAAAVGEEAEEADTHKARWKHVEEKAAQKLLGRYGHQLLLAALGVILPAESHLTVSEVYDPVIGDGDAMGVAGQVVKDVLRATKRRFSVNDPDLPEERSKKRAEGPFVLKRLKAVGKSQLPFSKISLQSSRQLAAKDPAEHFHG